MINEFNFKEALYTIYPTINPSCVDLFLESIVNRINAVKANGFMPRFSVKEIIERIEGNKVVQEMLQPGTQHPLLAKLQIPDYNPGAGSVDPAGTKTHHLSRPHFISSGTQLGSKPPCTLLDSLQNLKTSLEKLKSYSVASAPDCREARLPLTAPLLKLALLEDPSDTGLVHEDLYAQTLKEAFPALEMEEVYQVVTLGRVGAVQERKVDYSKMLSEIEKQFIQIDKKVERPFVTSNIG